VINLSKKIFIIGGYGFGNLGDEAVLNVIVKRLKRKQESAKITVLSHDPQETRRFHGVDACTPLKSLVELIRSDEVIVGGGEVITYHKKPWFTYLVTCISLVDIIKVFQKKKQLKFSDIGVRPISSSFPRIILSKLIGSANSISVRDISRAEFEALDVKKEFSVVPDPALELEPADFKTAQSILRQQGVDTNKFLVGLSVAAVKNDSFNQKILEVIPQVIDWLSIHADAQVVFISTSNHKYRNREKDLLVADKIQEKICCTENFKILRGNFSPREIEAIIGQMNLFLVMRLHPLILAHNMKVPSICIAYYARVKSFCKLYGKNKIDIEKLDFQTLKEKILASFERYIKKEKMSF
jgi:polysaccharide pyruvyl transferase WcaK-like protein